MCSLTIPDVPPEINALISLFEEEEEEEEALVRAFRIGPFFPRTEEGCLNDDALNLVEERDDDVHGDEEDVVGGGGGIILAFLAGGASACAASRISSFVCKRKKNDVSIFSLSK